MLFSDLDRVVIASADSDLDMVPDHVKAIPGQEWTEVVSAKILADGRDLWANDSFDQTVAIDRAMHDRAVDHFDYDEPLDEDQVSRFLDEIGAGTDGIRDDPTPDRSERPSR